MDKSYCCENFEKMFSAFGWFRMEREDGDRLLMPYIEVNGIKWRVNNCPSCGAKVRFIEITEEQYADSYKL